MFHNFTFEYPYLLLFIIPFLLCFKYCKPKKIAILFSNIGLIKKATKKSNIILTLAKVALITFTILAIASPIKEDEIVNKEDKGYEISLILDASGSMRQNGKFEIVKNIVKQFIDQRVHDKIGLSIFADFAYVAIPLTYDKKSIKRLLNRLQVGIAGMNRTALYEALFLSSNLFKSSHAKEKIAILLTDGIDNTNTIPLDVAINTAKKYGIKVYTIGIGAPGDYNPQVLQKIAKETGGKFFSANSIQKLQEIYRTIDRLEKSKIKSNKYVKKSYYFAYPLTLAMLFLLLYFYLLNKE